jgi:hypothetical protein
MRSRDVGEARHEHLIALAHAGSEQCQVQGGRAVADGDPEPRAAERGELALDSGTKLPSELTHPERTAVTTLASSSSPSDGSHSGMRISMSRKLPRLAVSVRDQRPRSSVVYRTAA